MLLGLTSDIGDARPETESGRPTVKASSRGTPADDDDGNTNTREYTADGCKLGDVIQMRDIRAEQCYYKSKRDVETHLNGARHRIDKPRTPGMISGARPLSFCPIACRSQSRRRPLEVDARLLFLP